VPPSSRHWRSLPCRQHERAGAAAAGGPRRAAAPWRIAPSAKVAHAPPPTACLRSAALPTCPQEAGIKVLSTVGEEEIKELLSWLLDIKQPEESEGKEGEKEGW
jgi:hypothetical protein